MKDYQDLNVTLVHTLKKKIEVLKESEEKFKNIFDNANDGIVVADAKTQKFVIVNFAFCKLLGYDENELYEMGVADIHPKKDLPYIYAQFEKQRQRKIKVAPGLPVLRKNGEVIYCDVSSSPVALKGRPFLMGFFRDVTEVKKAEKKLKASAAFTESALNSIVDVFYAFDLKGKFLIWNKTFNKVSGYNDKELSAKKPQDFFSGKDIQRVAESVKRIYKEGVSKVEANFVLKNGKQIPCEFTGAVLRDGEGNITGFSGTARDLSERKNTEDVLKESEEKYRALFRSSSDAIMTLAPPTWKFTEGNPAAIKMFRAKNEKDFASRAPWEFSPKYQLDGKLSSVKAKEMIGKAMKTGRNFFEWTHRRLNGEDFLATVLLTRLEIGGKKLLQATVRDIAAGKTNR